MKRGRLYLYPQSKVDRDWSPFTLGTYQDLKEADISPLEGQKLQFYNDDADDQGNPDDLLFEGLVHFVEGKGWGAIIDASTFHWKSDEQEQREPENQS